jgi:hypothetical protein
LSSGATTITPSPGKILYCVKEVTESAGKTYKHFYVIDSQQAKIINFYGNIIDCCFSKDNMLYVIDNRGIIRELDSTILDSDKNGVCDIHEGKIVADLSSYDTYNIVQLICTSNSEKPVIFCATKDKIFTINLKNDPSEIHETIISKESDITNIALNESESKILMRGNLKSFRQGWFEEKRSKHNIFNLCNINQDGLIELNSSYMDMPSDIEFFNKISSSFVVGEDKLIISYYLTRKQHADSPDDVCFHFLIPSSLNHWSYIVKQKSRGAGVSPIRILHSNKIVINTTLDVAQSFPLCDDAMLDMLNYLDTSKEPNNYSYNQKLDGILLLYSLLHKEVPFQLNRIEKEIFDTCLPKSIQGIIKATITRKIATSSKSIFTPPQPTTSAVQTIKPESTAQQTIFSSLKNYAATTYNSLQEKIAKHKQSLLFGAVYTLGTAAIMTALYKYLESRPVPVYPLK